MSDISFSVEVRVGDDGEPVLVITCDQCQASLALDRVNEHVRRHRLYERVTAPPAPVGYRLVVGPSAGETLETMCLQCTAIVALGDVSSHSERHWDEGPA